MIPGKDEVLQSMRHTTAHVLAQAVKRLYPETKPAKGTVVVDGFYCVFETVKPFTAQKLPLVETAMRKIIAERWPITRLALPKAEAAIDDAGFRAAKSVCTQPCGRRRGYLRFDRAFGALEG